MIPKGNIAPSLELHQSAAKEAKDEAGVLGSVCPIPLGSYRYRKRRRNGASLMADVQVFPMAVSQELSTWKEQAERERRWFTLAEASELVDEADLRDLMRSFGASQFKVAAKRRSILETVAQKSRFNDMFAWFQRLLPKTVNFFELFEAHARANVAGADALARLLQDPEHRDEHIREISEREHDADEIINATLGLVRQTFLTPFDRGAIIRLITAMDDAIDEMQSTAGAIDLYDLHEFDKYLHSMTAIVIDCARLVAEAMPLLRDVARNATRLSELTGRIIRLEGHTDEVYRQAMKELFHAVGEDETRKFIAISQVYKHLEEITDAFEEVAKEINGIVVDHA